MSGALGRKKHAIRYLVSLDFREGRSHITHKFKWLHRESAQCGWHHSKALDAFDTIAGSDSLNGQELATLGTINYQLQDFDTDSSCHIFLVGTVEQVEI